MTIWTERTRIHVKRDTIKTLHLPVNEPIPFGDDLVPVAPDWRVLQLGERGEDWITILDREDYNWALEWLWFIIPSGYAVRSRQKVDPPGGKLIWLHREIMKRAEPKSERYEASHVVDHLSGFPLDNRKENLRWATLRMNAKNIHGAEWKKLKFLSY